MCTIAIWYRVDPEVPLIVAANRDELYARPTRPPEVVAPGIVSGVDEVAGGTWMGATADGFFAGLTNVRPPEDYGRPKRSRGEVVANVLRAGKDATALLQATDPTEYNPFYLLFGDADGVRLAAAPPGAGAVTLTDVAPGMHVLPNGPLDAPSFPKVKRTAELVPDLPALEALRRMLGDHELAVISPFASICVHTPSYGTGSSTLLYLGAGTVLRYLYAPGPPCVTPFSDVTGLLR